MPTRSAVASGAAEVQRKAAADAVAVQDAVNIVAVVGCLHRHLLALHAANVYGDDLINHPVALAFVSKLNSLCRMTPTRELAALGAIDQITAGETVEFEVIPIV
jgi:hypothetical protein